MSAKKKEFNPVYRLFPSSLLEKFTSGEFGVKALLLISDLAFEVIKRSDRTRHFYQDRSKDFLQGNLSKNYREVVEQLLHESVVEVRLNEHGEESFSTTNHRCKQYRLTKTYRKELIQEEVSGMLITDHRQLKRMHNFFMRSTENLLEEHDWLKKEVEGLKQLRFQIDAGNSFLNDVLERQEFRGEPLTQGMHQALMKSVNNLDNLLNSDKLPHVSLKHGRVFHSLVNAHKELREFVVTTDGEKLVELDMRAAQWVSCARRLHTSRDTTIKSTSSRSLPIILTTPSTS